MTTVTYGTELKINVHVDPLGDVHMSDYNFECTFYTGSHRKITITKSQMKFVDDDNYIVTIETPNIKKLGKGNLMLEFTGYIPDGDFSDSIRTEKTVINTYITIG